MNEYYDAIIVGTGAAGLYCALNLPKRKKILMLTKQGADLSDSFLAQGGICMLRGEDDYEDYFEDTMRAGHYENNKRAVNLMIRSSNDIIRDLLWRNVDFVRAEDGELAFTREGAHSRPRILFHEDITGKEITQTLLDQVKTKENIEICEYMTMVDIISKDNICGGVIAMDAKNNVYPIRSQFVVLACGGIGGLFQNSTNYPHIAGDGLGIAMKHQVKLEHLDYIQIHPTTLFSHKPGRRFLISESVRGEVHFFMTKTVSVLRMNCSQGICSVRRFLSRWKRTVLILSGKICVRWVKKRSCSISRTFISTVLRKDLIREKSRFRLFRHSTILWEVSRQI